MDMYSAAVCNELKNALQRWEVMLSKQDTTRAELDQLRYKINGLCAKLDQMEVK